MSGVSLVESHGLIAHPGAGPEGDDRFVGAGVEHPALAYATSLPAVGHPVDNRAPSEKRCIRRKPRP